MNRDNNPRILRADLVHGDTLTFRDAVPADAEFILSLRTDAEKSRYLSHTSDDLDAQRAWLEHYASGEGQAYFIIEFDAEPIGTVRVYDARDASFSWGSWILKDGRPRRAAMESALMVYAYATAHLGFSHCHFEVRKGNQRVLDFHERFGAERTGETELDHLYGISQDAIQQALRTHVEFLSDGVRVDGLGGSR